MTMSLFLLTLIHEEMIALKYFLNPSFLWSNLNRQPKWSSTTWESISFDLKYVNKSNRLSLMISLWRPSVPHTFSNAKLLISLEHEFSIHGFAQTPPNTGSKSFKGTMTGLKGWKIWPTFLFITSKKSMSFSSCDSTQFFNPHTQFLSMEDII